ncbi:MAG TPA: hypothetical protein VNT81_22225 [Vicinamibacterales bacterium]|nr:hypothetical protein [Vicinamibacterales bacterium]
MTEGVAGSRFRVGAWLVTEDRDRAYDGSSEVDNPMRERTQITVPLLTLDIRLTERFGIQAAASVPDVTRSAVIPRASGALDFSETFSGIGDTSVVGWYKLRPVRQWYPVVNFGTSVPTGRTETPRFRSELQDGSLVPMSRLQRGSGTVDPLAGAHIGRRFGKATVFGSVAARIPLYENGDGLQTGASAETNVGLARELGHHRITGLARVGWLHRQQDTFRGTRVLVGGGNWLYVTPGIGVLVGKGVNVQAEVKLPLYRSLSNKQLDSSAIFQFGISRAF